MSVASDIPVRIEFTAEAAQAERTVENLQKELEELSQGAKTPALEIDLKTDPTQLQNELANLAKTIPPFEIPAPTFSPEDVLRGLDQIKTDLNEVANLPALSRQAQGYTQILQRLREWQTANATLVNSSKALQSQIASMTRTATEGLRRLAEQSRELSQLGQQITLGFAGVGTVLGGLATGAVAVASNFEQLRQRLITVTGSAEKAGEAFAFAQEVAAKSPFDVEAVTAATASLEAFELKARDLLPVVANLAAGRGVSLQEAALVFAKAATGGAEGFESLRNEYGITTRALLDFGAAQGEVAGQLSHAEKDIDRNRDALVRIINTRFGDAIARQSATFAGAMSNAGDTAKNLADSFGSTLLPLLTAGARTFSLVGDAANKLPTGVKAAVAGIVVVGAAVGVAGASIGALVVGMLLLRAQLLSTAAAMATDFPVAATLAAKGADAIGLAGARAQAGVTGLARGLGAARASALAFLATPLGLFLVGLAGATAIAVAANNSYADSQEKLGDQVGKSADALALTSKTFRDSARAINEAGKDTGVTVGRVRDSGEQMKLTLEALDKLSPDQLQRGLEATGETTDKLKEKSDALAKVIKEEAEAIARLKAEIKELETVKPGIQAKTGIPQTAIDAANGKRLELKASEELLESAENAKKVDDAKLSRAKAYEVALNATIKASKDLGATLDLSKQVGSTNALSTALSDVNSQIAKNKATSGVDSDNLDQLLNKLRDTGTSELAKEGVRAQIRLLQEKADIEEAIKAKSDQALEDQLNAQEAAVRRRKALGDITLEQELQAIEAELKLVQQGTDKEIALQEAKAAKIDEIRRRNQDAAEKSFSDLQRANQQGLDTAREGGDQSGILRAIEANISRTQAWRNANVDLIAQYPEIAEQLLQVEHSNAMDKQKQQTVLAKQAVQDLATTISTQLQDATTNTQKLEVANRGLQQLQRLRRSGLGDEAATQTEINALTRTKLGLEQQIADAKRAQQEAIKSQEQQNLDQEISILEARKSAGENVDEELTKARQDAVKSRLEAIDRELEAEKAKGSDMVLAEELAARKRDAILQGETLRQFQENQKQTADLDQNLTRREERTAQHFARLGGLASPLKSHEEAFNSGEAFSLGDFNFDLKVPLPRPRKPPANFRDVQDRVRNDFKTKPGSDSPGSNTVNNDNKQLIVNGQDLYGPDFSKRVLDIFRLAKHESRLK